MPVATRSRSKNKDLQEAPPPAEVEQLSSSDDSEDDVDATAAAMGLRQRKPKIKSNPTKPTTRPFQPTSEFTLARWMEFLVGGTIFVAALPLVTLQILCSTAWEFVDQHTIRLMDRCTRFNRWTGPHQEWLVVHPKDSFVVNTTVWLGGILPAYFVWEALAQSSDGFVWWRAALYNIVRIGPMYRNFMYVYVLCHKEAHCFGRVFAPPYASVLQYVYNYYIGFFHGVLPGPFTQSHIYNHHKYDNARDDVYSTGAFPRDSFFYFLRYIYVWFLYALNLSTMAQFHREGKTKRLVKTVLSTLWFLTMVGAVWYCCGGLFVSVYVLYPVVEGNILLAMVNYTWHAFIDPNDHDNDYVNSVTILDGLNFCLSEEYHVVHHQYAGIHWSRNEEMYQKHFEEYVQCTATVFRECNIFVIWGMIVAKDYEGLTEHFVQLNPDESKHLSKPELAQLLKERLQCTTWSYN